MRYDQKECGVRMAALRHERNWVQEEAAEMLHVSLAHYKSLEAGRKSASIELMVDIAALYECSLDYLIIGRPTVADFEQIHRDLHKLQLQLDAIREAM